MKKVFIIAEAGVNHNGSVATAKKMVEVAAAVGADAVKFQTFKAEKEISKYAPKAKYQEENTGIQESQLEMAKKLELTEEEFEEIYDYCKEKNIIFLSTPSDLESIDILDRLGLEIIKIPSGEITDLPYLQKIGNLKKKIMMSTGMADLEEIRTALGILTSAGTPKENIIILHCNTEYPTPFEDVNLLAMLTMRDVFKMDIGYSDHTLGIETPIAAVAMGATIIEKHFTLDRAMNGPDHKMSLTPNELETMVKAIRNIEKALGDGIKKPSPSEIKNIPVVRKSIVAAKPIGAGETFTIKNITTKRPGVGISPMEWYNVVGKIAKRDFIDDEIIEL